MKKKIFLVLTLVLGLFWISSGKIETNAQEGNVVDDLVNVFAEYYNSGVYVKSTQINVNDEVKQEVSLFHARASVLNRTTYYNGDELWFESGSGYGTSEDGKLTQFRLVDGEKTNEKVVSSLPGMEEYYCTLDDFVKGTHTSAHTDNVELTLHAGWSVNNGVYASTDSKVLDGFRLFTAPLWLGKTETTANYIDYTKATVEEVGDTLVMKLWVSVTESSKLVPTAENDGTNAVFSVAVVAKDVNAFQVYNGDFELGNLNGWTKVGQIGQVTDIPNYWYGDHESVDGFSFNRDGSYHFSSYADDNEGAYGYLKSSTFVVGGNGWITFKLGAARNTELLNFQVVDATNGNILKTFGNVNWADRTNDVKSGCTLNAYKANISDLMGKEVYIKVVDNATHDYGCLFLDSVNTFYTRVPGDEFALAEDLGFGGNVHQVFNGDFERGNLDDWGGSHNKEGEWFYSSYAHDGLENNRGYLQSTPFEIGGNGWITFKYGGALNGELVNIQVVDAITNEVITVLWKDRWEDSQSCGMFNYKADLSDLVGRVVYFKFVDYAWDSYGLFYVDSIYTNYTAVPGDEFAMATRKGLTDYVVNGDFEYGNLAGWMVVSGDVPGEVLNGSTYWNEAHSLNKDGEWSFQAIEITHSGYNTEWRVGVIRSNSFILNANSLFSFKLSGGNHPHDEGIRVVNVATGEVLAQFTNTAVSEGRLTQYHYQFTNSEAIECYIEIFDHLSGGWGLVGVDSLVVNAGGTAPDSIEAINQR